MAARLAARLGWTEGQVYTAVLALLLAVSVSLLGLPAVLRHRGAAVAAAGGIGPGPVPQAPSVGQLDRRSSVPKAARSPTGTAGLGTLAGLPPAGLAAGALTRPPTASRFLVPTSAPALASQRRAVHSGTLRVTSYAWAAADPTPLDSATVAKGDLPISRWAGSDQRRSFVRLAGTGTQLLLPEAGQVGANVLAQGARIQACPITTTGWAPRADESFASEPGYRSTGCAPGRRGAGGMWVFDLAPFPHRAGGLGFALVPVPGVGPGFQVTLIAEDSSGSGSSPAAAVARTTPAGQPPAQDLDHRRRVGARVEEP